MVQHLFNSLKAFETTSMSIVSIADGGEMVTYIMGKKQGDK